MDLSFHTTPLSRYVGEHLANAPFCLVDIGCGGGIDDPWRVFDPNLKVLGVDADSVEVERLRGLEQNPRVQYLAALVEVDRWVGPGRNPWGRLAVADWRARHASLPASSGGEVAAASLTQSVSKSLPALLADAGFMTIDFLKLDVDGPDFAILKSLKEASQPLALALEVNFIGDGSDDENSFHNVDRWLRRQGFDLYDLTARRYSAAALPGRTHLPYPAETHIGRILQGDALYVRDPLSGDNQAWADELSPQRLLKTAAIFSMFGLSDCAAETLLAFRDKLAPCLDVDEGLDLLALQAQDFHRARPRTATILRRTPPITPSFAPPGSRLGFSPHSRNGGPRPGQF